MEHVFHSTYQPSRGGGRVASPAWRHSQTQCEDFTGLEADVDRYELLLLVKRAGKSAGFTSRMIQLLDYYMAFTREIDWEEGSRPIVYQSLARTALDLGVSERQIQKLEKQLFDAGALSWNDSGNHRRYGQRHPETGVILYAFGVELTPLAYLKGALEQKLQEKRLYDEAWLETKRQISWHRRQMGALLLERQGAAELPDQWQRLEESRQALAVQIRTHIGLAELRTLLAEHQALAAEMLALAESQSPAGPMARTPVAVVRETRKSSPRGERLFVHYKSTTQESFAEANTTSPADDGLQGSVAEPPERTDPRLAAGMQHITLKQVLAAGSERFRERLPLATRPLNWQDVTEAAYALRPELHISQASWGDACQLLGRAGAAVCLLLTDRAALRDDDPVLKPAAYFRGIVNKARRGELRLHNSIFGLLSRSETGEPS